MSDATSLPEQVGDGIASVELVDANLDGIPDVLMAFEDTNDVGLFPGAFESGHFVIDGSGGPPMLTAVGSKPTDARLGDINGDGWPDLVCAVAGSISVSWGIDGSSFGLPAILDLEPGPGSEPGIEKVVVADVNGDGFADVAGISPLKNSLYLVMSGGSESYLMSPISVPAGKKPVDIIAAELNGDNCAELIVASRDSSTVSVLVNSACP